MIATSAGILRSLVARTSRCGECIHKRSKSRDHEIVRAHKKVSQGHPKTPPKTCSVVKDPQVYLNQMLLQ